jgi:predicted NBD/HSP70 family sugar kinase
MSQTLSNTSPDVRRHLVPGRDERQGTDLQLMHEFNRLLVLNCVRENRVIARAEVARRTNLSRTTVGNIIDELIIEGFVREGGSQRSKRSGGRRIVPVHFNTKAGYVIGIAMGRNHLTLLLTDLVAEVISRRELPFATQRGPEVCLAELAVQVQRFMAEHDVTKQDIFGIGVGMPGPIDSALERSLAPPRMPGWDQTPVRQILTDALGMLIFLGNNGYMGALGESRYGVGKGVRDLLYVRLGSGIGSGLLVGGQIYRGGSGSAGEIGHMTIDPEGPPCACGKRGCLEALASGPAILSAARKGAPEVETLAEVIEAAQAGEVHCRAALKDAGEAIGMAFGSLINFFNPSMIVLDGSIIHAGDLILDPIRQSAALHALPAPLANTVIVPAAHVGHAIALGGVATVIDFAFSSPGALSYIRGVRQPNGEPASHPLPN